MATHMNARGGINACADDILAPDFYRFNSRWDGVVNGQRVTVFAGCLRGNPKQGVMLVRSLPKDEARKAGRHIDGPAGSGSLRLVGWAKNRLKVLAENGDSVWFEVPAGKPALRAKIA